MRLRCGAPRSCCSTSTLARCAAHVDGVEITIYEQAEANPTEPLVKGPLAMTRHGGGTSEYQDIFVEVDPTEDELYTVKPK